MLGIFVIAGCVLMTCAGPPIGGYSSGSPTGGRGEEYSRVYRSRVFAGAKNPYGELGEQLGSSGYAGAATHRYTVAGGVSHPTPGSGYSSDSGYSDAGGGSNSGAFGGHPSGVNTEALSVASSSSYSSNDQPSVQSPELGASSYASVGASPGLGGYTAGGGTTGNHGSSTFADYTEEAGSHGPSSLAGLTGGDRTPTEYSTASHPSPSYITYTHGGPKSSSYTPSASNHRGHGPTSHSSNPSVSFMSGGHRGGSGSSYYPSESGHAGVSSGPSYSSGPSLGGILTGMHSGGGPSNYVHGVSGHRPSPNHIYATSSNQNPSYSSRLPSSGYFSSSPYSRGGGKIILVKESSGGGGGGGSGGHVGHMYPGEQHNYNGGMFGGASRGYKLRSVVSGPGYGPSLASGYTSSGGYSGNAGHSSSNHGGGGFFSFL